MVNLQGLHTLTLDDKGRIAMPIRYRNLFKNDDKHSLIITLDLAGLCLWLYPLEQWEKVATKIQSLPSLNSEVMRLQRLLVGHAIEIEIDSQGRLLIPTVLRECAKLNKNLILMGQGKRFELWDAETLEKQRQTWLVGAGQLSGLANEIQEIVL